MPKLLARPFDRRSRASREPTNGGLQTNEQVIYTHDRSAQTRWIFARVKSSCSLGPSHRQPLIVKFKTSFTQMSPYTSIFPPPLSSTRLPTKKMLPRCHHRRHLPAGVLYRCFFLLLSFSRFVFIVFVCLALNICSFVRVSLFFFHLMLDSF